MIIVWSGFGFATALIGFAFAALGAGALQPAITGAFPNAPENSGLAIGLLAAAAANWYLGLWLNSQPGRELVDPKTNQRVMLKRNHTLFWIPMQFFSALMLVLAVVSLFVKLPAPHGTPTPDNGATTQG